MDNALIELIKISNAVGKDPTLVQGGGGNTSVKTDDGKYMYIKASGTALKDMTKNAGFRRLRLDAVRAIVKDKSLMKLEPNARETYVVNSLMLACDDNISNDVRPSVESNLHAFLNKYVIHLHPNAVGAYLNARNGQYQIEKLFKDEKYPPLWVPYIDPGIMLSRKITALVESYQKTFGRKPAIMLLEKHGLFVSADNPNSAQRLVKKVIKQCSSKLLYPKPAKLKNPDTAAVNKAKLAIRKALHTATGQYRNISFFYDSEIAGFLKQKNPQKLLETVPLAPDELVYAGGPAMWVTNCDADKIIAKLTKTINSEARIPSAFMVKGLGLFVAAKTSFANSIRDVIASSLFIRTNAARFGGIIGLNKRQQQFINQWEAESFRKELANGTVDDGLQNRIAVVTGAGSGLGRSIAVGLARAGASVAIADIDTNAANQTVQLIKNELPDISATVLECNVTDEAKVNKAFETLLDNFGGLDILVNAAGVAPAYPLIDLPVEKWRFALEINLTGYFLMAKAAAKIMIEQNIGGNIINISSKSGLDPSKNNTPYNATKAGELHMARGWALELGEHAIRVNCVCPGNVFEGSKIWNPQYINTCAKKYGIKPEEVIPYYVNKTILKREIKGQDIADSVVFLCSEKARTITGQTIVADSGQVMVR